MEASTPQYPRDLRNVLRHADRFARLLFGLEREERAGPWMVGRSGELRAVVSYTLADWRAGRSDGATTLDAIRSYLDGLHRDAAQRLHVPRAALDCCADDAITEAPAADTAVSLATTLNGWHQELPTVRAPWKDGPEVLARLRDELPRIEAYARTLARRLGTRAVTKDDLLGFGREGLLDAARSFDERRGIPFANWASLRIRSAMMDGVRRWGGLPRRVLRELNLLEPEGSVDPINDLADGASAQALSGEASRPGRPAPLASLGPPAQRVEPDRCGDLAASPEELLAQAELHALLRKAIGHLPKKEREAVEGYYFSGRSLKQVAAIAGVTESGASRMLTRALQRVDAELRSRRVVSLVGRPPKA